MTGSLIVTGFIETQELRTTYISSSILYRSGSTKFGDELSDTHAFTGSLLVSGSINIPGSGLVSGSSQITYSGLSGVPSGVVSGSVQVDVMSTTNIARLATTGSNTFTANIGIRTTPDSGTVSLTVAGETLVQGDNTNSYATFLLKDMSVGGSQWGLFSGFPTVGDFTIRESGVANHLVIKKTTGDATFTGTGTFTGGGNTLTLKKGTGSPAIAFAGTSDQATGLIEGVSGGGIKFYTSTGTISSPSWSTKLLITPSDGIKFGPNAVSIIGTEGSHGFHYLYSAGNPKIYLEANGVAAFLNPNGVGVNDANPSKRLTVNYGATGSDGLYVYGSQRQHTIFRSTGEHCFLYIDSFHQNTYLPVIHFQRSSTTYGAIGLNRASNSDALGSWTESEMYVGTETNTPISLKVNNERIVIVSSSSMQVKSTILPTSDATYNLGSTTLRWNNVYTTDLHLSNKGKTNDVDGTWGDWTLQEGENDLFMINHRSGDKFKIILEKINK
jgi:hypothetical protein